MPGLGQCVANTRRLMLVDPVEALHAMPLRITFQQWIKMPNGSLTLANPERVTQGLSDIVFGVFGSVKGAVAKGQIGSNCC